MITVTVTKKNGRIAAFEIKGHAGYARHGKDIVCAAVSAAAQTALIGLLHYFGKDVDYTVNENGYMRFTVPCSEEETADLRSETIAETLLLGLKDLESGYKAFVKLEER